MSLSESFVPILEKILARLQEVRLLPAEKLLARIRFGNPYDYDPFIWSCCRAETGEENMSLSFLERERRYVNPGWPWGFRLLSSLPRPKDVLADVEKAVGSNEGYAIESVYILSFYASNDEVFHQLLERNRESIEIRLLCVETIKRLRLLGHMSFLNELLHAEQDPRILRVVLHTLWDFHSKESVHGLVSFWQRGFDGIAFENSGYDKASLRIDALSAMVRYTEPVFRPILEAVLLESEKDLEEACRSTGISSSWIYNAVRFYVLAVRGLYQITENAAYLSRLVAMLDAPSATSCYVTTQNQEDPINIPWIAAWAICDIFHWDRSSFPDMESLKLAIRKIQPPK